MSLRTFAIAIAADTNVEVAGGSSTSAPISTQARTINAKLTFVPTSTPAVVSIAEDAATLTAGEGFPIFADSELGAAESLDLVSADALWVRATEAGVLYVAVV